jgi:hypothetical protein
MGLSYCDMLPLPEQRLSAEESHLPRPELEVAVLVVHHGHNHASCVDQHLTQRGQQ